MRWEISKKNFHNLQKLNCSFSKLIQIAEEKELVLKEVKVIMEEAPKDNGEEKKTEEKSATE